MSKTKRVGKYVRLHRERVRTLLNLRALNNKLELESLKLKSKGIKPPLDGYTDRLGGTEDEPVCAACG
jgi:hypothetical protein